MATESMSNKYQIWILQTWSHEKHIWTANIMKCGHNKQFLILKYTSAAALCETNEGAHQTAQKNADDYLYYALMATEGLSNTYQNWNLQTWYHGKHYWTANIMKYGHHKQFLILKNTSAAATCEINEGVHKTAPKNANDGPYFVLKATECSSNNYQIWILQTWSHDNHFWTANIKKYGHNKQLLI